MISIRKAAEKHKDLVSSLLAVYGLTGCDTVSKMIGIGKGKALNVMKKITLQCLEEKDASYTDFLEYSKIIIAHCYGITEVISSSNRIEKSIQSFSLYCIQNKKHFF